jgi:hypothetical protein
MTLTAEMPAAAAEQHVQPAPAPADAVVTPETVLAAIRTDCLLDPARYLDEVRVPFGGE